ncbi:hypothetical protein [Amycolatopsis sp. cmx-4-54]
MFATVRSANSCASYFAGKWFRRALAEVVPWDQAVAAEAREGLATLTVS